MLSALGLAAEGAAGAHGGGHGGSLIPIGEHWKVPFMGGQLNLDTVAYAGVVMLGLLIAFAILGRMVAAQPVRGGSSAAAFVEQLVGFCEGLIKGAIGPHVTPYLWFVGAVFTFILTSNWLALLPWKAWETWVGGPLGHAVGAPHPLVYEAPTGDLNTTVAMALVSLVLYWYFGIKQNGVGGFLGHHWFAAPALLFPLRMLEDVTRPMSLALRLFANVTAGHVVGLVLLLLTYAVVPSILMPLELFVGAVQAYVFAVLSASYIGAAVADHGHEH